MHAAAASFCPLELPAVTVAAASDRRSTGRSAASASSDVSARGMLVALDDDAAPPPRHLDRHELGVERARLLGGDRALVRTQGECVLRLARDAVVGAQHLGRADVALGRGEPSRRRPSPDRGRARRAASARRRRHAATSLHRVERRVRHRLRAERDDDVGDAGLHLHRRVEHGLQARAAAPVELVARSSSRGSRRRGRRPGRTPAPPSSGSPARRSPRRPRRGRARCGRASARSTVVASSRADTGASAPPMRPTGVRSGEQTTTSRSSVIEAARQVGGDARTARPWHPSPARPSRRARARRARGRRR